MVSLGTLIDLIGSISTVENLTQKALQKLRDITPNDVYVDLLDTQIRKIGEIQKKELSLDKSRIHQLMRNNNINLYDYSPQKIDLDRSLSNQISPILRDQGVINGRSEINDYEINSVVARTNDNYFRQLIVRVPELERVITLERVMVELRKIDQFVELFQELSQHQPATDSLNRGFFPPRPIRFVGRETELSEICSRLGLFTPKTKRYMTIVRSFSGEGKTTLIREIVHMKEVRNAFPDGILWVSFGQIHDPWLALEAIAQSLDLKLNSQSLDVASDQLINQTRERKLLLVLNNLSDARLVDYFKLGNPELSAIIICTNDRKVAESCAPTLDDIYVLPKFDHGFQLFERIAPSVAASHTEGCRELINKLENSPLGIVMAASLLRAELDRGWDIKELITELTNSSRILTEPLPAEMRDLNTENPTLSFLLQKSVNRLSRETQECLAMIRVADLSSPISLDILEATWHVDNSKDVIDELLDRGFSERSGELFYFNPLLSLFVRSMKIDETLLENGGVKRFSLFN